MRQSVSYTAPGSNAGPQRRWLSFGEPGWRAERVYHWLILLPLVFLGVFFIWPLLWMIARSVLEPTLGLSNYSKIVSDGPYLRVLWLTLKISVVVTVLCLIVGYPASAAIARSRPDRADLLTGILLIPLWTSVVIRSYAWMIFFQRNGIVNETFLTMGLIGSPLRILQTETAVYIAMVHILLPYMMLPLIANMRAIDRTLLQAGEVLGAQPLRLFLKVYLPLSVPGVTAGVSLVFITALGFFITPALLGGSTTTMISQLIEQQASTFLDWPLASALASLLLAVTATLYLTFSWITSAGRTSR